MECCDFPDELQLLNYCMQLVFLLLSPGVFNLSNAIYWIYMELSCIKATLSSWG